MPRKTQYRALGWYGVGEFLSSVGAIEVKTNSGEASFPMCDRKRGLQGAAPTLEGVVAVVDMMRTRCNSRVLAIEAILRGVLLVFPAGALRCPIGRITRIVLWLQNWSLGSFIQS